MTDDQLIASLDDRTALALTIFGEAAGEPIEGKLAVGVVVRNRLISGRFGDTFKAVCLARKQFSCWNAGDPNRVKMLSIAEQMAGVYQNTVIHLPDAVGDCFWVADGIIAGRGRAQAHKATHYYAKGIPAPFWAVGHEPAFTLFGHLFFAGIK